MPLQKKATRLKRYHLSPKNGPAAVQRTRAKRNVRDSSEGDSWLNLVLRRGFALRVIVVRKESREAAANACSKAKQTTVCVCEQAC